MIRDKTLFLTGLFYVIMQDKQAVELDGLKRYLDFKEDEEK